MSSKQYRRASSLAPGAFSWENHTWWTSDPPTKVTLTGTSLVDTRDVAEVVAAVLERPAAHVGKVYELTGPRSEDMRAVAAEYSEALGRIVTYVDVPWEEWRERELRARGLPDHVFDHLLTMAQLHADNRYDRLTHDIEAINGRPVTSIRDFVLNHPEVFGSSSQTVTAPRSR